MDRFTIHTDLAYIMQLGGLMGVKHENRGVRNFSSRKYCTGKLCKEKQIMFREQVHRGDDYCSRCYQYELLGEVKTYTVRMSYE